MEDLSNYGSNDMLLNIIKNINMLKHIFNNLSIKKFLQIIKVNKKLQKKFHISIKDYEDISILELEIIPCKNYSGKFINIMPGLEYYFHIYFNTIEKEIKSDSFNKNDKVTKIIIRIDRQVKSFNNLFLNIKCIESVKFNKFYRSNITSMSYMFSGCNFLKEINFFSFKSENVTNMSYMFQDCYLLQELDLCNFNTSEVTQMTNMFFGCSKLQKINLDSFNTEKVRYMNGMFSGCSLLSELDLSNFKSDSLSDISYMFEGCSSLNKLNLFNFKESKIDDMTHMFKNCLNCLTNKIKYEFNYIKDEAF